MTAVITVTTERGTTRVCGARCHNASPDTRHRSRCVCGGMLHGVGDEQARAMAWEHIEAIREKVKLAPGETMQLRIGA